MCKFIQISNIQLSIKHYINIQFFKFIIQQIYNFNVQTKQFKMINQRSFVAHLHNSNTNSSCMLQQKPFNNFLLQKKIQHQKLQNQFQNVQQKYYTPIYQKIKYYCKNHKKVNATHFILTTDHQKIAYCEKCSILIASQGFSVIRLDQQNFNNYKLLATKHKAEKSFLNKQRQKRIAEIEQLEKMEQIKFKSNEQIFLLTQQIKIFSDNINQVYQNKINELTHVFTEVFQFLKAQRQKCFQTVQSQLMEMKAPLEIYMKKFKSSNDNLNTLYSKITAIKKMKIQNHLEHRLFFTVSQEYSNQLNRLVHQRQKNKNIIQEHIKTVKQSSFTQISSIKNIFANIVNKFFSIKNSEDSQAKRHDFQTVIKQLGVKIQPFSFGNQNAWTPTSSIAKIDSVSPNDLNKSFLFQLNKIEPNDIVQIKKSTTEDPNIFEMIKKIQSSKKNETNANANVNAKVGSGADFNFETTEASKFR